MTTQTIAGYEITLTDGNHYIATRKMGEVRPVLIRGYNSGAVFEAIYPETYDEANDFLNAFNNGTTSFEGRVW